MEHHKLTDFKYIDKEGNKQTISLTSEQIETVKQNHYIKKQDGSIMKFSLIYNDFNQDKSDGNINEF